MTPPLAWSLRGHLYRHTRDTGTIPTRNALHVALNLPMAQIDDALCFLADIHVLVLDKTGEVRMAHPFSAIPTPYRVKTPIGSYWANCAWDAIAIPILLDTTGRTPTVCPLSGAAFDLAVMRDTVSPEDAVVRFGVPVRAFWNDIGFT